VAIVWIFAVILTVAGAYDHASQLGQRNCRTDRLGLVSAAPWSASATAIHLHFLFRNFRKPDCLPTHFFFERLFRFLMLSRVVSNFLRVRVPYPFQWGSPTFDVGDVFGVMAAAYASLIEVTFLIPFCLVYIYSFAGY